MSDHTIPKEVTDKYRAVFFGSPMGLEVLGDILNDCHYGSTLDMENPHQIAEYNVGVVILAKCGVLGGEVMQDVVRALSTIMPTQQKEDEE